jgi:hypothetical protein
MDVGPVDFEQFLLSHAIRKSFCPVRVLGARRGYLRIWRTHVVREAPESVTMDRVGAKSASSKKMKAARRPVISHLALLVDAELAERSRELLSRDAVGCFGNRRTRRDGVGA